MSLQSEWPDVGIKSSPTISQTCQICSHILQNGPKRCPTFELLFKENLAQDLSRIAQSGHTD